MLKKVFTILVIALIMIGVKLDAQTVQAGISSSGTDLIISAKPDGDLSGNFSAGNITITWPTSYGVTLGTITNSVGNWFVNDVGTSSTNDYVNFAFIAPPVSAITWTGGNTYELFRVVVNQTGTGTGTFTLNNTISPWYFEVSSVDHTNTSTPFYSDNVSNVPLPVELLSFTALASSNNVNLNWKTATEVNNDGFEIQRKVGDQKSDVSSSWEKIGFIQGHGNSNSPKDYTFVDKNLTGGTKFIYRLKQIDNDGQYQYSKEVELEVVPKEYALYQNYPNPFNPTTNIKFNLPEASRVTLNVYNIIGQQVVSLINGNVEAGYHSVVFNASNLPSGTYIYRLQTSNFIQVKKMVLLK